MPQSTHMTTQLTIYIGRLQEEPRTGYAHLDKLASRRQGRFIGWPGFKRTKSVATANAMQCKEPETEQDEKEDIDRKANRHQTQARQLG